LLFVDVAAIDSRVSAPVVAVGRRLPGSPSVSVDAAAAAETGIRLLRRDGHRAIGLIGCAEGSATAMSMADVQSGFDSVAREGGVALHGTAIVASDATFEGGADAVTQLLCQWPPPSAVLAASDNVAAGARWAASAAGLVVPGELSIAGYGGSSVAANGDLTTLALPAARMGDLAATSLLQAIEGVEVASAVVQAELIVRGSTGRTRSATSTQSGAQTAAPTREPI
jgi:LacI family repressor for deo operon, udp, cdd, tsx, nupC, and nupG